MDLKEFHKSKVEILESVRFWLAVLRKSNGFTDTQKRLLDSAYHKVNLVYGHFETEDILPKILSQD